MNAVRLTPCIREINPNQTQLSPDDAVETGGAHRVVANGPYTRRVQLAFCISGPASLALV
jgi:hypothetical protein